MTRRFTDGGWRPSASAAFHPPAYQVHDTPLADSVSPIVRAVCAGPGSPLPGVPCGSAKASAPPSAGGIPLGWYGGCEVLTDRPSDITCPPPLLTTCTAPMFAEGDPGFFVSLPSASSTTRMRSGA